jgi:hypothetical protein
MTAAAVQLLTFHTEGNITSRKPVVTILHVSFVVVNVKMSFLVTKKS